MQTSVPELRTFRKSPKDVRGELWPAGQGAGEFSLQLPEAGGWVVERGRGAAVQLMHAGGDQHKQSDDPNSKTSAADTDQPSAALQSAT